jgi:phosphoribulokinase
MQVLDLDSYTQSRAPLRCIVTAFSIAYATSSVGEESSDGAIVTETINVAQYGDLLIGVVPIINLEWIQKLHRDKMVRGYTQEAIVDTILRRMPDYVNYICSQFSQR